MPINEMFSERSLDEIFPRATCVDTFFMLRWGRIGVLNVAEGGGNLPPVTVVRTTAVEWLLIWLSIFGVVSL